MGEHYRADYRGPVFHFFWPLTRYLTVHITALLLGLVFYVLNRATVIGRGNVPRERNTLLLSNHQTMIDSFLIGISAYYPQSLIKPFVMPWNPAAEENFYRTPILAFLAVNALAAEIDAARAPDTGLATAIRLHVLRHYRGR